jgi:DNA-binding HxlR family transcriptional regulator
VLSNDYPGQVCSIARALEVVGERWTLLIVRELLRGPQRFSDLERRLKISKNILTARLGKLVEQRIAVKVVYEDAREWSTYQLTQKGFDLFPVISALMAWGDSYAAPDGAPAVFVHTCGHLAGFRLTCEACNKPVDAQTVTPAPGPGLKKGNKG